MYIQYNSNNLKKIQEVEVGCWWLTSVILATWEAEIRRITI
jgi:hypothetical protein